MSLEKHTTFFKGVAREFKRRETDYGAEHPLGSTNGSAVPDISTFSPMDEVSTPEWTGKGGRVPWIRVVSGVRMHIKPDGTPDTDNIEREVSNEQDASMFKPKVKRKHGEVINGLILEPTDKFDDLYGITQQQTIGLTLDENESGGLLDNSSRVVLFQERARPSPIVSDINVKFLGANNTIREATFTWQAFTLEQFEALSAFFCSIQKTVILEWGWSSFQGQKMDLTNQSEIELLRHPSTVAILKQDKAENQETKASISKIEEILTPAEKFRYLNGVDYDFFIGIVSNFDVQVQDGIYVVTTTLRSIGEIMSSMKSERTFKDFFDSTKFNDEITARFYNKDPRVWYRKSEKTISSAGTDDADRPPTNDMPAWPKQPGGITTREERDAVTKQQEELKVIVDKNWEFMTSPNNWIFYNPKQTIDDWLSGTGAPVGAYTFRDLASQHRQLERLGRVGMADGSTGAGTPGFSDDARGGIFDSDMNEIDPMFLAKLGLITESELGSFFVRSGALMPEWNSIDNPADGTLDVVFSNPDATAVTSKVRNVRNFMWNVSLEKSVSMVGSAGTRESRTPSNLYILLNDVVASSEVIDRSIAVPGTFARTNVKIKKDSIFMFKPISGGSNNYVWGQNDKFFLLDEDLIPFWQRNNQYIKYALEVYHRIQIGRSDTLGQLLATAVTSNNNDAHFGRVHAYALGEPNELRLTYNAIKEYMPNYSTGRGFIHKFSFQGGSVSELTLAFVNKLRNNSSGVRLKINEGDTKKQYYGILEHLSNAGSDAQTGVTNNSDSTLKIERRASYAYITWGLFEEILNQYMTGDKSKFKRINGRTAKMIFHENLISTNPSVCLIPNKNAPQYAGGVMKMKGDKPLRVDLSINGINQTNGLGFSPLDQENNTTSWESDKSNILTEDDRMWLHSIFVNTDYITGIFSSSSTLYNALDKLLKGIGAACLARSQWRIDRTHDAIKIVDTTTTDHPKKIYEFKYNKTTSFLRNLNMNMTFSSDVATQTIMSRNLNSDFSRNIALFSDTSAAEMGLVRPENDKFGSELYQRPGDKIADENKEEDEQKKKEEEKKKFANLPNDYSPDAFWEHEHQEISNKLVNFVYTDSETVEKYVFTPETPAPSIKGKGAAIPGLAMSFTVDGISGLKIFDAFTMDGLPSIYKESGFWFVTGVDHSVTHGDWQTTITAMFRTKSDTDIQIISSDADIEELEF